jgi:hypothetical protein
MAARLLNWSGVGAGRCYLCMCAGVVVSEEHGC